ncbi:hypothetical protein EUTSA_v10004910mg [Eutrema salsugineum]|uniref:Uncharacterized protein n=1 Tax=Eutrema salsugineum TaxID=72664 RepID=V4KLG8_EUTSA|nr:uncharacterized protein LOC18013200 isoform X1 [Eutrema salsugineum]ESQ32054.1 hypothetical protein EUTSA_v10004910mg [Eutrema salsugineum]
MVAADEWTNSAMRDGEVVAELLVRLKEAKVTPLLFTNPTVAALRWGIRQPRSRSPRIEAESAKNSRCSPSTPLSWSGGCGGSSSSPSAYVDGYEATSRRISGSFAVGSRFKVLVTADLDFHVKRFQSQKDIDIASLRSPFSERGIENKNLKRRKLNTQISTSLSGCNLAEDQNGNADGNFLLPDLNIMPCEETGEHYSSLGVETTLYGIRIVR